MAVAEPGGGSTSRKPRGLGVFVIGRVLAGVLGNYIFRRLLQMLLVVWIGSSLMFFMPRIIHQNAIEQRFRIDPASEGRVTEARREIARLYEERFGFERPVWAQYLSYLGRLARFDLGYSMSYYPVTVNRIVGDAILWTLGLVSVTAVVSFVAGLAVGSLLGWMSLPGWVRGAFLPLLTLSALPYYLVALGLVYVFAFRISLFPLGGAYTPGTLPAWTAGFAADVLAHAALPALSIIVVSVGTWAVQTRGMMATIGGEDFLAFGAAKGLKQTRLLFRYALRNALLPQAAGFAVSLGTMLTGVVLVEVVFRYPGLGDALHRAIRRGDYFVISGIVYVVIVALATTMFLFDVLQPWLDPRTRRSR